MLQEPEEGRRNREFQVLMEEYRALRTESIHLMVSRNTVLGFYFTGLVFFVGSLSILITSQSQYLVGQ